MAHSFNTNSIPLTGSAAMYLVITTLVAAGWTKPKDSDGTTYSSSGTQITSGSSGTNGLANTRAWFVVRDPNNVRSFCFQRGTDNISWRVKYSPLAGFVGGSPSGTQVPSATDEVVLTATWSVTTPFGTNTSAGTDASPVYNTIFFQPDGTYRFNVCACDSTLGYSFYWDSFPTGNASGTHQGFMLDVMISGTYPSADTDPAVIYCPQIGYSYNVNTWSAISTRGLGYKGSQNGTPFGLMLISGILTWTHFPTLVYAESWQLFLIAPTDSTANWGTGTNPFTNSDDLFPVPYCHSASSNAGPAPGGLKGMGLMMKFNSVSRGYYDTLSVSSPTAKDYIVITPGTILPWDGSAPSV